MSLLPDTSLDNARRIVVKIGSALLIDPAHHRLRYAWFAALIDDLVMMRRRGQEVIVVSSGAVALGRLQLGLIGRRLRLEEKQAAAATGQIQLAHHYQTALANYDVQVAQILLTPDDTENRRRHLNARQTLETLLRLGVIPVINENDCVATAELRFGDNDRLAARVAQMVGADRLVLLSDIDGLYTADPRKDPDARHIPVIDNLTDEIMAMAGEPPTGYSSGGMITKLIAARIATQTGCSMVIASGTQDHPLRRLYRDETGKTALSSWFLAHAEPSTARKNWIGGHLAPAGQLRIDAGAKKALQGGNSLLPAGVTGLTGEFDRGDVVAIVGPDGAEIGCGLVSYPASEASQIIGRQTDDIEAILGYAGRDELVHRDDMVLTRRANTRPPHPQEVS